MIPLTMRIESNIEDLDFGVDIGISVWNVARKDAPIRTGNLRRSIYLIANSPRKKSIYYDMFSAYYIDFLETGSGRNKKHKGFIENITVKDIYFELLSYFTTGQVSMPSINAVNVIGSKDKARNYERDILRSVGISPNIRLDATQRALMSKMYVKTVGIGQKSGVSYQQTKMWEKYKMPILARVNTKEM